MVVQAATSVAMQTHISQAEDRIWSSRRAYSQDLRAAEYGDIIRTKPHKGINHFLKDSNVFNNTKECLI